MDENGKGYQAIPMEDREEVLSCIPEVEPHLENYSQEEEGKCPPEVAREVVQDEAQVEGKWKLWFTTKLNSELIEAVMKNKINEVVRLLKCGASPSARCRLSMVTACHLAALVGEEEILSTLLKESKRGGAWPARARDRKGRMPHHLAAAAGCVGTLRILLEEDPTLKEAQVSQEDLEQELRSVPEEELDSYLHDHTKVSNVLAEAQEGDIGKYLNDSNEDLSFEVLGRGETTSNAKTSGWDSSSNDSERTHFEGFSPSPTNNFVEYRPMSRTFRRQISSVPVKKERDVSDALNILSASCQRGEHQRGSSFLHKWVRENEVDRMKRFFEKCRNETPEFLMRMTRWKDETGRTPALLAAELNMLEPLTELLAVDPGTIDVVDDRGRSPLYAVVEAQHLEGAEQLLQCQPNLELAATERQENVLHLAASFGNEELLRTLLVQSSSKVLKMEDIDHLTPLERALTSSSIPCIELLLETFSGSTKRINRLIRIAISSKEGSPSKKLQHLFMFFSNNISSIVKEPDLLHVAVRENSLDALQFLIGYPGVNVGATHAGKTVLHAAAETGSLQALRIILGSADGSRLISSRDGQGRDPLVTAALSGNTDCVVLLLKEGANLAARDEGEKATALEIIFNKNPELDWIIDEVYDSFLVKIDTESRHMAVDLDFKGLLADAEVTPERRQLGVLEAFIDCTQDRIKEKFFLHPVVECFLFLKWKFHKKLFYFTVLLYMIQILTVTFLALILYTYEITTIVWVSRLAVWMSTLPVVLLEMQFARLTKSYLSEKETWIRWAVLLSSLLISVLPGHPLMRYLAAVAVLLAWIDLLFLNASSSKWGLRVFMFIEVARNVFQVLTTFVFLLLGFAFSFLILFNGRSPFLNMWTTLTKVAIMMSEMEYNDVFGKPEEKIPLPLDILGRLFYIGFLVLVVMVLTNLMVGMSVSDVALIESQGKKNRTAREATFLVMFEKICYQDSLLNLMPSCLSGYIKKNRKIPSQVFRVRNNDNSAHLPSKLRNDIFELLRKKGEQAKNDSLLDAINEIREKLKIDTFKNK